MTLADALGTSSTISGIFPVIAALFNYKNLDKVLKITALFFLISTFFDWTLEMTKRFSTLGMSNNLPFVHAYVVISILFYAAIYYHAFSNKLLKKGAIVLSAAACLLVLLNSIFVEGIWEYPSTSSTVLSVLLICFSLAYFYQLLNRQEFIHIEKLGFFWINSGVLFYFSLNVFLFMLLRQLIHTHQQDLFMINIITNIIANIIFTVGLLCKPQKVTSYQY